MPDNKLHFESLDQVQLADIVRSNGSIAIEQCWRSVRGDALVPLRKLVTARDIPARLLGSVGICSVVRSGKNVAGSYRLAGSRFRQLTGIEITGEGYENIVANQNLTERAAIIANVLDTPAGVWWVSQVIFDDRYTCFYQSTLLPLRADGSDVIDHLLDLVDFEIPILAHGMRSVLSSTILTHAWIDIGAGVPSPL